MHKALHTAARARGSQLKLGAGQLQRKKKREGFFSIYKTKAALFCLSHAFIQLQSVCASLELHTPHSRVSTVVYVSWGGVTNSISRSSVWKPKAVSRRLERSMRC
ncbi:hypothetical protein CY35_03G129300 [Sphagnum magellanicum]|nr:hypothetical protein CY35_03G129300 [Sphagnum magellanicum]